jgi:hypothetical protein
MVTWLPADGPDEIAERLRAMLALVDLGRADVVPPGQPPTSPGYRAWPDLDPAQITTELVMNGQGDGGLIVSGSLEIQCHACRRRYEQSWVPERGYERWTVSSDRGAVPGPPAG